MKSTIKKIISIIAFAFLCITSCKKNNNDQLQENETMVVTNSKIKPIPLENKLTDLIPINDVIRENVPPQALPKNDVIRENVPPQALPKNDVIRENVPPQALPKNEDNKKYISYLEKTGIEGIQEKIVAKTSEFSNGKHTYGGITGFQLKNLTIPIPQEIDENLIIDIKSNKMNNFCENISIYRDNKLLKIDYLTIEMFENLKTAVSCKFNVHSSTQIEFTFDILFNKTFKQWCSEEDTEAFKTASFIYPHCHTLRGVRSDQLDLFLTNRIREKTVFKHYGEDLKDLSPITGFVDLKVIDLQENLIEDIPEGIFEHLKELEYVDLKSRLHTKIHPKIFSNHQKLEKLSLNGTIFEFKTVSKNSVDQFDEIISTPKKLISLFEKMIENLPIISEKHKDTFHGFIKEYFDKNTLLEKESSSKNEDAYNEGHEATIHPVITEIKKEEKSFEITDDFFNISETPKSVSVSILTSEEVEEIEKIHRAHFPENEKLNKFSEEMETIDSEELKDIWKVTIYKKHTTNSDEEKSILDNFSTYIRIKDNRMTFCELFKNTENLENSRAIITNGETQLESESNILYFKRFGTQIVESFEYNFSNKKLFLKSLHNNGNEEFEISNNSISHEWHGKVLEQEEFNKIKVKCGFSSREINLENQDELTDINDRVLNIEITKAENSQRELPTSTFLKKSDSYQVDSQESSNLLKKLDHSELAIRKIKIKYLLYLNMTKLK